MKRHPDLEGVSWTYGNFVLAWDTIIAQYSGYRDVIRRIGSQGIVFPHEVKTISEYLSTVEARVEHGEDFASRLEQLQTLFSAAAKLPGGIVYNS